MKSAAGAVGFGALAAVFALTAAFTITTAAFREGSFKAFYCAGQTALQRRDPYRVEPLRTCERAVMRTAVPRGYVEPAPLPGFVIAAFAVLALLPFRLAGALFAVALFCVALAAVRALAQLSRAPPAAVLAVLMPLLLLNLALGEIPPFAMCALAAAGWSLAQKRAVPAGIAAALSLVEPHVGLPVVIAVALYDKRTRAPLAVTAIALVLVSTATLGLGANLEYVRAVLPAQAFAELPASDQYSLSHVAYAAGVPARGALLLGEVSYAVMACFGVALGLRLARVWKASALAAFLPAAAVLFGGVFMHDIQMIAAMPAALLLASVGSGPRRAIGGVALALLAVVWTQHVGRAALLFDAIAVAGAVWITYGGRGRALAVQAAAVAVCVVSLLAIARYQPVTRAADLRSAPFDAAPDEPAPAAWGRYERATPALVAPRFYQQLPTWVGLGLLLIVAAGSGVPIRLQFAERHLIESEIQRTEVGDLP